MATGLQCYRNSCKTSISDTPPAASWYRAGGGVPSWDRVLLGAWATEARGRGEGPTLGSEYVPRLLAGQQQKKPGAVLGPACVFAPSKKGSPGWEAVGVRAQEPAQPHTDHINGHLQLRNQSQPVPAWSPRQEHCPECGGGGNASKGTMMCP